MQKALANEMPYTREMDDTIEFVSPVIPTLLSTTPYTVNTSAPAINDSTKPRTFKNKVLDPQIIGNRKTIKQERMHDTALKMVYKLEKISYRDTGFLNSSTKEERQYNSFSNVLCTGTFLSIQ